MENWIGTLSPDLFWDVDQAAVDPAINARWLVERVLQRGRWKDWQKVSAHYGKARLSALRSDLRVDAKSAHFLELYCES